MNDNPFSEPEDNERTVLRLPTGGRAAATPSSASNPPPPSEPAAAFQAGPNDGAPMPKVGRSPLTAAAAPLLDLLARIGARGVAVGNPEDLRDRAMQALRTFEGECRAAQVPQEQLRAAHYALCAALDDTALATPWGQSNSWAARSLSSTFHQDVRSGERFFDLLAGMQKEPGRYLAALEVCYLCLSLGFRGKYRLDGRGGAEVDRIREGLYQLLASAGGTWERELSPRWRGVDAPHKGPGRRVPAWVIATVALAVLALGYVVISMFVSSRGDALQERLVALPPAQAPAMERSVAAQPPAAPPPASGDAVDKFRQLLAVEISQGLVMVQGNAQRLTIRVLSRGMFDSGRAEIQESFVKLLQRIGEGLRAEPGQVLVVGHSDNQRIRTVQFPSNFELSTARAAAAKAVLGLSSGQPERFRAEGRADSEPVQSNTTEAGREANRRVEIVLTRAESR